jgi:nucleoside-diphosphate-sugar epimerase
LGNIIGKNDNKVSAKKNALQYMINRLKTNESINLYDNGVHKRDFIDVEDVAEGIKLILEKGELDQIYNLGNGEPVTIKTIIDYVFEKTNSKSEINVIEPTHLHKIVQPQRDFYFDIEKLKKLGYQRKVSLIESIDRLLND